MDERIIDRMDAIVTYLKLVGVKIHLRVKNEEQYSFAVHYRRGRVFIRYREDGLYVSARGWDPEESEDFREESFTYSEQEKILEMTTQIIVYEISVR